jgi:hypothetical protein
MSTVSLATASEMKKVAFQLDAGNLGDETISFESKGAPASTMRHERPLALQGAPAGRWKLLVTWQRRV